MTPDNALVLLATLGAPPRLVRHHELVLEAARLICDRLTGVGFVHEQVLAGAALHDAGKILHPEELAVPGNRHEPAGRDLLLANGVPADIARFCVTHAAWADGAIEDLLVALADTLWKGKRNDALEQLVVARIAAASGAEPWAVFDRFDALCEDIAAGGPDRLARS